ncbi:MAG: AarF/ABC1/UbiB kinase family protein [Deltaproteobacteria bacterium]|nr:AarF/ABC1/UbiB kinase family protein [Deltaproteobacteria bacterium]MBN2670373.1 AarF/ABC1/UbiB kinase family protein [Deltaproteobacteria bacterium]
MKQPSNRATIRFLKAYLTALSILASYGWFFFKVRLRGADYRDDHIEYVHRRAAVKIEKSILSLQGLFIKVGQLFSIMTNFLPREFRKGLENLQDAVPARPYSQICSQIEDELGGPPEQVFRTFCAEPIASASLGQVHVAETLEGEKVAVKVRHQNVDVVAKADLRTIWRILQLVKRFVRIRGLDNYYYEIKAMVLEELDFEKESAHIETIASNFAGNDNVVFPKVYKSYSGKQVLTLSYLEGRKISDVDKLAADGVDLATVARNLLTAYCQMIFVDGIYHADPHPGNILVQSDGKIVLLDFGAVGHLSSDMRSGLGALMESIIKGDEEQLLRSLKTMGFLRIGTDQSDAATKVIEHFHRKFQEEIKVTDFSFSSIQIDTSKGFEHLSDLRQMNVGIRELSTAFHMPREWVLLERTALQLTGICSQVDPALSPASIIRPYLEEFVLGTDTDWSQMLFDLTKEKVLSFLSLPKLIDKYVHQVLQGKVSFRIENLQQAGNLVYLGLQQVSFALLTCAGVATSLFYEYREMPRHVEVSRAAAGVFMTFFLVSMLRSRRYKK